MSHRPSARLPVFKSHLEKGRPPGRPFQFTTRRQRIVPVKKSSSVGGVTSARPAPSNLPARGFQYAGTTVTTRALETGAEGEQARHLLAAIVESAPDAMVIVGPRGRIGLVNRQTEKLFGYTSDELLGHPVEILVPQRFRRRHSGHRDGFFGDPKVRPMGAGLALFGLRKDGTEFPVEISLSPLDTADGALVSAAIRDVSERKQAEETVRLSEERLRRVIETVQEAFVSIDAGGLITDWNPEAEVTFGWSRDEALGGELSEMIIPPEYREAHKSGLRRFLKTKEGPVLGKRLELEAVHRDGHRFPVELTIAPVQMGDSYSFHAFLRDVTERKQMEEELQHALEMEREAGERLRDLDRLKDEFLATVSHELRTPLTAITAFAEVLSGSSETHSDRDELVEGISRNAVEMGGMIEQLLDYSRLEAGKVALELAPLPLRTEALRCVEMLGEVIGSHRVTVDIPSALEVQADEQAFERILVNLLVNAAKYSPDESSIRLGGRPEADHVLVSVRDEGFGIPPEEHERIFERFYQSTTMPGKRGYGIGLSIARRYVELLGGRIWVESQPGRGSTFVFTLPKTTRDGSRKVLP
jgi:PAS domain S-box-containing protein